MTAIFISFAYSLLQFLGSTQGQMNKNHNNVYKLWLL
uniref:Uncharacterized protein n=1 Tax=Rhizophora mucronata TaxID=61149 RepID=A0A2P2QPL0_RHIMU